jgi:FtsH-binding integral membrane protein
MSDYNTNPANRIGTPATRADVGVDQGLRAYMLRVYNYMALGLAITGVAAWFIFTQSVTADPALAVARVGNIMLTELGRTLFVSNLKWLVIFGPFAFVLLLSFGINRLSASTAQILFWVYAATVGVSLATIFMVYTQTSIVRVFFITAASFGGLSLYGYTTRRDLTALGSFLFMGLIGVIIASVVNIWLASSMMQFIISVAGVLVFAGLTAYDTQKIKEMYSEADDSETIGRKAVMGALNLYLDFLNLFLMLLQLFGRRD